MTAAAIDELLRKLDFVAKSFNAAKLGLPIPGANEELRAVVDEWLTGSALRCEHSDSGLHTCSECDAQWAAGQMTQPESEPQSVTEADGCPTEGAVLKRFWREHQAGQMTTDPDLPVGTEYAGSTLAMSGES